MDSIIPYGTKILYKKNNCNCYCGHYNGNGTYNIYNGWDLCSVPRENIEIYEW